MTGCLCPCIHTLRGYVSSCRFPFNYYYYLLRQFFVALPHCHSRHCNAALSLSLCPEAKCPVAVPDGSMISITSWSVCLCTFSLLFGCRDWKISHSVRLKKSHVVDKSCAEGAPSPRSSVCFLRLGLYLSTRNIFFPPIIIPPSLSLQPPYISP